MDVHCRPIAPKGCLRNPLGKEVEGRLEDKKFKPTAIQNFCFLFLGEGREVTGGNISGGISWRTSDPHPRLDQTSCQASSVLCHG